TQPATSPAPSDAGACSEPEITAPVDECLPDGRLNRHAIGWSRRPLQRCNLSGHWPPKKRWDYWCVTTDTHLLSLTYANIDYLGLVDVWMLDYATKHVAERGTFVPFAKGFAQPDTVGGGEVRYESAGLRLRISEDAGGTCLRAGFKTRSGTTLDADIYVES